MTRTPVQGRQHLGGVFKVLLPSSRVPAIGLVFAHDRDEDSLFATEMQASDTLNQRMSAAGTGKTPTRSRVTFRTLAGEWDASVLPMYKHSTQKHRRFMLKKHLLPRFGDTAICDIDAAGDPGVRGSSHAGGIRAEVHRSHSRRAERGSSHGGEVGASPGESCAGRRHADAQMRPSEVGIDDGSGSLRC